jgi:hypothetical protein
MNSLKKIVHATALASLVSLPAFAGDLTANSSGTLAGEAFSLEVGGAGEIDFLSEQEMVDTKGELAFLVAAIVGIDLALIGTFWGVYVPNAGGGSCLNCSLADLRRH